MIRPKKNPGANANGEARQRSLTTTAAMDPVSKVFGDDNLLWEIFLRNGFPTTLVRAALVCKCWYQLASDRGFLRRFRELHPPHLLGFYVQSELVLSGSIAVPRFVPMLTQPPEFSTLVHRMENQNFEDHKNPWIMDCRNGSIFTGRRETRDSLAYGVHCPLCPERGIDDVPPLPTAQYRSHLNICAILSKEEGNGLSYFYVSTEVSIVTRKLTMCVYMLQGSVWCLHASATDQLQHFPIPKATVVLANNKIYMLAYFADGIIVLDLMASSLSRIQLPPGLKYHSFQTFLSRADDPNSGVYLIHVNGFRLCIWLHRGDSWSLVDTICLHEMCANLGMLDSTLEDEHTGRCYICQAGDNAEFVFLQMHGCVFYLDIKNRTIHRVYTPRVHEDPLFGAIHPFTMAWPPTFPALKNVPATARIAM